MWRHWQRGSMDQDIVLHLHPDNLVDGIVQEVHICVACSIGMYMALIKGISKYAMNN
jgi:hypothetical protein